MKIALFGCGRIGQIHLHNLLNHSSVSLAGVVDPHNSNLEAITNRWKVGILSEEEVFSDSSIDAVFIASASSSHYPLIQKSLQSGKHIFCEKPLDSDIERVRGLIHEVDKSDKVFSLGFQRRADNSMSTLQKKITTGVIGKLENVTITSRDPAPPPVEYIEQSGGMFNDMTIHDFDVARWLVGEEMVEVYAVGDVKVDEKIKSAGDIDSAVVCLKSKSGVFVQIINSRRAAYGYDQRIEAFGSKGMLQVGNHLEGSVLVFGGEGTLSDNPLHFFLERYQNAYSNELDDFVRAIESNTSKDKTSPQANHHDGLKAMELALAARQSLESGLPVKINI